MWAILVNSTGSILAVLQKLPTAVVWRSNSDTILTTNEEVLRRVEEKRLVETTALKIKSWIGHMMRGDGA